MLKITKPSKRVLPPITMRNRLWSESWCSDWRACCGGYGGQRPSRRVFSKSRRIISATLEGRTKSRLPRVRSFMRFFNANSDRQAVSHGVTNSTETSPASGLPSAQGQVAPDVELAHCFLRLCNLPNYYALDRLSRY